MARIKVDVNGLRDNANKISQQIQTLESLNNRLDGLLNRVSDSWTGNASEQYIETMRLHKQKTQGMITVLQNFKGYMEQAATRFESVDHDGASRIRNS